MPGKRFVASVLVLVVFLANPLSVFAASSPWTETDWSGQSGSNVVTSTAGQITLSQPEKLSNTGFESDLSSWNTTQDYSLYDQFTTNRSAGAVNGTSAEPTGGTRTVTDTANALSIASNQLNFSGSVVTWGDPGLWYPSITRTLGRTLIANAKRSSGTGPQIGFDTNTNSLGVEGLDLTGTSVRPAGFTTVIGSATTDATYQFATALRAAGSHVFIKGGTEYPLWTYLGSWSTNNTATLYPMAVIYGASVATADNIRIPSALYIPSPLVSDGFSTQATTDGAGHAEANGGSGLTWADSQQTVASPTSSPTLGSELLTDGGLENWNSTTDLTSWSEYIDGSSTINQDTTNQRSGNSSARLDVSSSNGNSQAQQSIAASIGNWILESAWIKSNIDGKSGSMGVFTTGGSLDFEYTKTLTTSYVQHFVTGRISLANPVMRFRKQAATSSSIYWDDLSTKILTLSSLISNTKTAEKDSIVKVNATITAGTQGGVVASLDSTSSPANFVIGYHDGTKAYLDKNVAGTYTNLISSTVTYVPGAEIKVVKSGTSYSLYYNGSQVGTTQTVSDAGIISNTLFGLFNTYSSNSFTNLIVNPSTWTVSGGSVSNVPTAGAEDISNGDFETGAPPTGWTAFNATLSSESTIVRSGSKSLKLVGTGANPQGYQLTDLILGNWFTASGGVYSDGTNTSYVQLVEAASPFTSATIKSSSSTSWVYGTATGRITSANSGIRIRALGGNSSMTMYADDFSVKPLTASTLFRSIDASTADVLAEAAITGPVSGTNVQGGLVLNLDSATTPANFIIVYLDGAGNVKVDEAVAGVYTNKASTAITYSAGAVLRAVRYGTSLDVYYNNAKVGSTLTMTANTNTKHGLFSTYSGNTFDNFVVWARGTGNEYSAIPADDLTITRDTGTTYSSSAGAAKLVATTDGFFTQNVNVGDTRTYNLSAYAYTTGAAVTSADVGLYFNNANVTTTYTSVGGGWYQLTGTVTGVNSSVGYGVKVKAGKTVYVDNFSLAGYATSGTLTSSIFDAGWNANWGTVTSTTTTPTGTTATASVRTSASSDMSSATSYGSPSNGHRYAQYQVSLASTVGSATPTYSDFSMTFTNAVAPTGSIGINSGATYTNSRSATLNLSATDDADSAGSLTMETSEDSGFSGASYETYATSKAFTLSTGDGSKTVYARFKDSNGSNVSSSYSDTITLDTTAPTSATLSSPSDGTYTSDRRPEFTFTAGSDATSGVDHYSATLTKSYCTASSETCSWNLGTVTAGTAFKPSSAQELTEGTWTWKVTTHDTAGNTSDTSRLIYIDLTSPSLSASISNQGQKDGYLLVNTQSPYLSGTISDSLKLDKLQIAYKKQNVFLGVVTSETLVDSESYTNPPADFTYTTQHQLDFGKYTVEVKAVDKAGNSASQTFKINILPQEKINLLVQESERVEEHEKVAIANQISIPDLEKKAIVRREMEAAELTKLRQSFGTTFNYYWDNLTGSISTATASIRNTLASIKISPPKLPPLNLRGGLERVIPDMGPVAQVSHDLADAYINTPISNLKKGFDSSIVSFSRGVVANMNYVNDAYETGRKDAIARTRSIWQGQKIVEATNLILREAQKPVVATNSFFGKIKIGLETFGAIVFDKEPTKITDVTIAEVGKDYAIVTYKTNHPAWGKVNYGETLSYGNEVMLPAREYLHTAKLTGLEAGKKYFFEVMAQNKNYAYDAYYVLEVPK